MKAKDIITTLIYQILWLIYQKSTRTLRRCDFPNTYAKKAVKTAIVIMIAPAARIATAPAVSAATAPAVVAMRTMQYLFRPAD